MAHDAAPNLPNNGGHEPTTSAQTNGQRPSNEGAGGFLAQSLGQGGDGEGALIDKKTAADLHDAAHMKGASEPDLAAFARVLALLCGGEDPGAEYNARDRRKMTRDQGEQVAELLKNKLSPEDHAQAVAILKKMIDEGEAGEGEAHDEPPPFQGRPTPGGKMVGDARRQFEKQWPEIAAIGRDATGIQMAPRLAPRPAPRSTPLATDAGTRGAGGASVEINPDIDAALASIAKIGRAF